MNERSIYCRGQWTTAYVSDGYWVCALCGKRLWQARG